MKSQNKHKILLLTGFVFLFFNTYSQDTIRLDKKVEYYSSNDTIGILKDNSKNVYWRADYARELIKKSESEFRLEYCFYYDNKRYIHYYDQIEFKKCNDSVLDVKYKSLKESWIYSKKNDTTYFLKRFYNGTYEIGYAKKIIPLEKIGKFISINQNNDTIWTTEYYKNYYPQIEPYNIKLSDTVFEISEIDIKPRYIKGDSILLKSIRDNLILPQKPFWESSIYCRLIIVSVIIDKKGYIRNVEFIKTCGDSFTDQEALRTISKLGRFSPGKKGETKVNVKMQLPIIFDWQ